MFLEVRFPPDIGRGVTGGPMFATAVIRNDGGFRQAKVTRDYPLHVYDATKIIRDQASYDTVKAFFIACRGRAHGFRFKDWADFTCDNGAFEDLGGGQLLLVKPYSVVTPAGTVTLYRRIQKPVEGSVTITGGGSYALEPTTGVVTVAGAAPESWSGQFDTPVAFASDTMDVQLMERNLIASWGSIKFEEIAIRLG